MSSPILTVRNHSFLFNEIKSYKTNNNYKQNIIEDISKLVYILRNFHFTTYQHSLNVSWIANLMGKSLKLSHRKVIQITIGALLHDIGKIKIDQSILNKPGKLNNDEWEIIRNHPKEGVAILSAYPWTYTLSCMIGHHHEKIDGSGYYGLEGKQICLGSRIISIADSFDAMTSLRPYQKSLSLKQCFNELDKNRSTQFDSELVSSFISLIEKCMNSNLLLASI